MDAVDAMQALIGKKVFIRTVTYFYTGEVVSVDDATVVLKDAAWIAETGRFATTFLKDGKPSEVEPFPAGSLVYLSRGAFVDVTVWDHELPALQV